MTDATPGNFDRAICVRAVSERVFLAGAALLFAATAAATIVWCNAMPAVAQPVARKRPGLRTNMVAIDLPGFGRSERKDALMSPRAMGNFIVHVADTFGLDHSHVVSPNVDTSASLFAAVQPDRLRSLVAGTGGTAVPIQLGEPLREWFFCADLEATGTMTR